jgi:hypothetical protein
MATFTQVEDLGALLPDKVPDRIHKMGNSGAGIGHARAA